MKKVITATLIGGAVLLVPACQSSADASFIERLDEGNIPYVSKNKAIEGGHSVCDSLDAGYTVDQVNNHLLATVSNATPYEIGYVVGASVYAYCDEYGDQIV